MLLWSCTPFGLYHTVTESESVSNNVLIDCYFCETHMDHIEDRFCLTLLSKPQELEVDRYDPIYCYLKHYIYTCIHSMNHQGELVSSLSHIYNIIYIYIYIYIYI